MEISSNVVALSEYMNFTSPDGSTKKTQSLIKQFLYKEFFDSKINKGLNVLDHDYPNRYNSF